MRNLQRQAGVKSRFVGDSQTRAPTGMERFTARYPAALAEHDGTVQQLMNDTNRALKSARLAQRGREQVAARCRL